MAFKVSGRFGEFDRKLRKKEVSTFVFYLVKGKRVVKKRAQQF